MLVHPEHVAVGIIGQMGGNALQDIGGVVGALRAPGYLPEVVNGALFEAQWMYWVLLGAVAGTLWFVGRNRADARLMRAGEVMGGVLLVWLAAAYFVDTPRERLYRAHAGLADAAKNGDVERILGYLGRDFHASVLGIDQPAEAREEIGARLKSYGVRGSTITFYRSDLSGRGAFTTLTLVTQTDIAGPVQSTWHLSWDDVPGEDWKVHSAELVKVGDEAMGGLGGDRVLPR